MTANPGSLPKKRREYCLVLTRITLNITWRDSLTNERLYENLRLLFNIIKKQTVRFAGHRWRRKIKLFVLVRAYTRKKSQMETSQELYQADLWGQKQQSLWPTGYRIGEWQRVKGICESRMMMRLMMTKTSQILQTKNSLCHKIRHAVALAPMNVFLYRRLWNE